MTIQTLPRHQRGTLATAMVITRRELADSLRDWRIMTPILILTLLFPFLMDFTAAVATNWIARYANTILAERINPFLLMIVGFFPMSFSLVIALESFVGEKERNSLEPILSMPVSDLELYLGKMLSSLLLPLAASYLGISVFLLGRQIGPHTWAPSFDLAVLIFLLTTAKATVMVCGAVVISSQTTSVRAANLLASFIIIPMALLVQVESVVMFYADYLALWWIFLGLLVVDLILMRMGIRIFNREEILSKEMDELNFKSIWHDFWGYFLRPPELAANRTNHEATRFNLLRFYRHDIPHLIREQAIPFGAVLITLVGAAVLGSSFAEQYPLPAQVLPLDKITADSFQNAQHQSRFLPGLSVIHIFLNNIRVIVAAGLLSIFSFGVLALLIGLINMTLVSFLVAQVVRLGHDPWLFIATFIVPHGILEVPALLLGVTFALRIGAAFISPPKGLDVGQGFLLSMADFTKIFLFLLLPMLLVAALIEATITPQIILAVYAQ
jgi:uncharacterized membrane protein SpoIIM required for sporulation/ABC-type transport system involved in multi-copper enzyme maturation permease subunit